MAAYHLLPGWKAAADAYRADLRAAALSVMGTDPTLLKGAFTGKPRAYGGDYPAWVLYSLTSRGQCRHAERFMPAEMVAQVLIVAPVTAPASATEQSGRAYAEEVTHAAFAAWIDRLWDLHTAPSKCVGGVAVSSTAMGAEDEFGRTMFQDSRSNALWAHSSEIVATL